jgi:hypothetical protein
MLIACSEILVSNITVTYLNWEQAFFPGKKNRPGSTSPSQSKGYGNKQDKYVEKLGW